MEIKMNREIRDYSESVFFGLSLRQLFFSFIAVLVAICVYGFLKPLVGLETVSWLCILLAVPFALLGFLTYHGMKAETFLWVYLISEWVEPKWLGVKHANFWKEGCA
ncbi:MAG: PrgI family protein [Clostridia bacterium]|nr:PrgI family protein [Clostridia bacterium]